MVIRRFQDEDASAVSALIARTLREVNSRDYPKEYIEETVRVYSEEIILDRATWSHMYVACDGDIVIGCGAIAEYWGSKTESILLTIFILPEYEGRGIGRRIIETLENDEFFQRTNRIEIPASITACGFYRKMGYHYKNNVTAPDSEGCIRMEKFRKN